MRTRAREERLGITGRGAGGLRQKFISLGITEQTASYKPNVAAACYRWLACHLT